MSTVEDWVPSVSAHPSGLMTPAEVAAAFGVSTQTITRWNRAGRLASVIMPSGRRRYRVEDVHLLMAQSAERGA